MLCWLAMESWTSVATGVAADITPTTATAYAVSASASPEGNCKNEILPLSVTLTFLYLLMFLIYCSTQHAGQSNRCWNVCPPCPQGCCFLCSWKPCRTTRWQQVKESTFTAPLSTQSSLSLGPGNGCKMKPGRRWRAGRTWPWPSRSRAGVTAASPGGGCPRRWRAPSTQSSSSPCHHEVGIVLCWWARCMWTYKLLGSSSTSTIPRAEKTLIANDGWVDLWMCGM